MILSKLQEEFAGAVKFVFQPAEEIAAGARKMVEEKADMVPASRLCGSYCCSKSDIYELATNCS
ncbi:M20/M25/M40 family metallo-hydrolase [Clostridium ljungdahlii]|uniref:Putative hydrolase YxeP n=1 Tax=Clostridium ljungdahlii TaxID=1538 RepID=A0A162LAF3_9CLOT|nr:M20/M25/M40 family metallo-hydrolase [Clostridium ljungdahlii]OAA90946.1 putative hydrolase YxeP [Clostridium ljungdahlii]